MRVYLLKRLIQIVPTVLMTSWSVVTGSATRTTSPGKARS